MFFLIKGGEFQSREECGGSATRADSSREGEGERGIRGVVDIGGVVGVGLCRDV